jgi:hypothetical protein
MVQENSYFVFKFIGLNESPSLQRVRIAGIVICGLAVFCCIIMIFLVVCRILLFRSAAVKAVVASSYEET